MKEIQLTKGYVALVDDEDYDVLSKFKWCVCVNKKGKAYAMRRAYGPAGSYRPTIRMHRVIMGVNEKSVQVDHKDMDGLNNQKSNLRLCSDSQNKCNKTYRIGSTSKYKGVSWQSTRKVWVAQITFMKRHIWLGRFNDEISAAKAYNAAAIDLHGEFARVNEF